jgi:hypothetical protein
MVYQAVLRMMIVAMIQSIVRSIACLALDALSGVASSF